MEIQPYLITMNNKDSSEHMVLHVERLYYHFLNADIVGKLKLLFEILFKYRIVKLGKVVWRISRNSSIDLCVLLTKC